MLFGTITVECELKKKKKKKRKRFNYSRYSLVGSIAKNFKYEVFCIKFEWIYLHEKNYIHLPCAKKKKNPS